MKLKSIDIDVVAKATEADARQRLAGLRKSLRQAKRGEFGAAHTLEVIAARRHRSVGSV